MRPPEFRAAGVGDAVALRDLERETNLAALGHVFPPSSYPFPDDDVLGRWHRVLADPEVRVEVCDDGPARLACFVAWDVEGLVRHLGVHPDMWGRGLGREALTRAVEAILDAERRPRLWCLRENGRAGRLYRHLGWRETGRTQAAEWPPYPVEVEYVLDPPSQDVPNGR